MRLATVHHEGRWVAAVVGGDRVLPLVTAGAGFESVRAIAAGGAAALDRVAEWADRRPESAWRALAEVVLGPAVADPGAVYTIGLNYRPSGVGPGDPDPDRPERPLVYGKAVSSVAGHGATLSWDRSLTANVDGEVELGIVIGSAAFGVAPERALEHVFGYSCVNDVSSRDPWLDGDQWLIGKSMPGFCPLGPWVVTADELDPTDLRLGCTIGGEAIQDGRTSQLRFGIAEIVSYLSHHLELRPGDVIASGTPARLETPPGPGRRLQAGDMVTVWIEGIGELTTKIA
jgi:2-keto-4-pentenoate hydratase/2-oxohepta-3-ene-1,7-dioic acid hydratase in catechol pathway